MGRKDRAAPSPAKTKKKSAELVFKVWELAACTADGPAGSVPADGDGGYDRGWSHERAMDELQALVTSGTTDPNEEDEGFTPLAHACRRGNDQAVITLLGEETVKPNTCGDDGMTALHYAVMMGHTCVESTLPDSARMLGCGGCRCVRWLILASGEAGRGKKLRPRKGEDPYNECVDLTLRSKSGCTALHYGAHAGTAGVVQQLLEAGELVEGMVNLRDQHGQVALQYAARKDGVGHANVIEKLLSVHATDVDARNNRGWTSLHLAVSSGRVKAAQKLISDPFHRINVNAPEQSGWTALHLAAYHCAADLITLLLDDPRTMSQQQDRHGRVALDLCGEHEITNAEAELAARDLLQNHQESLQQRAAPGWSKMQAQQPTHDAEPVAQVAAQVQEAEVMNKEVEVEVVRADPALVQRIEELELEKERGQELQKHAAAEQALQIEKAVKEKLKAERRLATLDSTAQHEATGRMQAIESMEIVENMLLQTEEELVAAKKLLVEERAAFEDRISHLALERKKDQIPLRLMVDQKQSEIAKERQSRLNAEAAKDALVRELETLRAEEPAAPEDLLASSIDTTNMSADERVTLAERRAEAAVQTMHKKVADAKREAILQVSATHDSASNAMQAILSRSKKMADERAAKERELMNSYKAKFGEAIGEAQRQSSKSKTAEGEVKELEKQMRRLKADTTSDAQRTETALVSHMQELQRRVNATQAAEKERGEKDQQLKSALKQKLIVAIDEGRRQNAKASALGAHCSELEARVSQMVAESTQLHIRASERDTRLFELDGVNSAWQSKVDSLENNLVALTLNGGKIALTLDNAEASLQALEMFAQGLTIDPANRNLRAGLARAEKRRVLQLAEAAKHLLAAGEVEEAVQFLTDAIELEEDEAMLIALYNQRSEAYTAAHDYEQALDDAEYARTIAPRNGEVFARRGIALLGLKLLSNAFESFRAGLHADPSSQAAADAMAAAHRRFPLAEFPAAEVTAWLQRRPAQLAVFADVFASAHIDGEWLETKCSQASLQELGIHSVAHQKAIAVAVMRWREHCRDKLRGDEPPAAHRPPALPKGLRHQTGRHHEAPSLPPMHGSPFTETKELGFAEDDNARLLSHRSTGTDRAAAAGARARAGGSSNSKHRQRERDGPRRERSQPESREALHDVSPYLQSLAQQFPATTRAAGRQGY